MVQPGELRCTVAALSQPGRPYDNFWLKHDACGRWAIDSFVRRPRQAKADRTIQLDCRRIPSRNIQIDTGNPGPLKSSQRLENERPAQPTTAMLGRDSHVLNGSPAARLNQSLNRATVCPFP